MGVREKPVEDYLRQRVKGTGGTCRKLQFIGRRGALDNIVWYTFPKVAIIECKAPGEEIDWRSSQGRVFKAMEADGWPTYVVASRDEVDAALREIMEGCA